MSMWSIDPESSAAQPATAKAPDSSTWFEAGESTAPNGGPFVLALETATDTVAMSKVLVLPVSVTRIVIRCGPADSVRVLSDVAYPGSRVGLLAYWGNSAMTSGRGMLIWA